MFYTALAGLLLLPLLLRLACPYFFRDLRFFLTVAWLSQRVRSDSARTPPRTILEVFTQRARRTPRKPLVLFREEVHTYGQVDKRSSQVARALREHAGLQQGDCLALFLGNEPAYLWIWLGLAKLGCAMACLNCNIRAKSLLHCFQCSGAKVLLAAPGETRQRPACSARSCPGWGDRESGCPPLPIHVGPHLLPGLLLLIDICSGGELTCPAAL